MGKSSLNGELAESFMGHSSSLSSYLAREGIYTRGLGTFRRIGSNQDLKLHPVHLLHGTCTNSPIIPKVQIRKSSLGDWIYVRPRLKRIRIYSAMKVGWIKLFKG